MRAAKVLVSAVAVLVVLSGCGSTSGGGGSSSGSSASASDNGIAALPASEILQEATAAALAQSSVHAVGASTDATQSVSLDLTLAKAGDGKGTLKLGKGVVDIISTGGSVYLRGDQAFWESAATAAVAKLIGDKWLKAPADSSSFKDLASMANFSESLGSLLKPEGTPTKGEQKVIDGTPAIGLVDGKSTLWIATVGEPLPLKVDGSGKGDATFEWGVDATVTAPPADQTIDLSQLGG